MRLLRLAWHILVGIKDLLVLLAMLLFFALLYAAFTATPNPAVPGSGALLLDLDGIIVEQPAELDAFGLLTGSANDATREHRLRDVVRALETAAADDRVTTVALDLDGFLGGGASAVAEVGDAIQSVRDAGKPVIAYATGYTDDGYQLAAHASEVWLDPLGGVFITGPGGNQLYFSELIERLGITAHIFRVGTYKSAVEPLERMDQSPEARAANQELADTVFELWREDVGAARPGARLAGHIADPVRGGAGTLATRAREAGLVDRIGDRIDWTQRLAGIVGADETAGRPGFQAIPLANWVAANPAPSGGDAIGVITVAGNIVDGEAGPGTAAGDTIATLMREALVAHDFRALVIRIDSPGGSVLASEQIRRAILEIRDENPDIPIVASMGSLAASGGYYVATAADHIFAEPSTITGSIGVFAIIPSFEGSLDQLGIGADGVTTTPLSGEPDVLDGLSPEVEALFQASVEDVYARFLVLVSRARDMPVARVNRIAQGRVWAGATARRLGLVDDFGSLDDAVVEAARRAGLDPEDVHPFYIEKQPDAFAAFIANWTRAEFAQARDPWAGLVASPTEMLARVASEARTILAGPSIQMRCLECPTRVRPMRDDAAIVARLLAAAGG